MLLSRRPNFYVIGSENISSDSNAKDMLILKEVILIDKCGIDFVIHGRYFALEVSKV